MLKNTPTARILARVLNRWLGPAVAGPLPRDRETFNKAQVIFNQAKEAEKKHEHDKAKQLYTSAHVLFSQQQGLVPQGLSAEASLALKRLEAVGREKEV